MRWKLAVGKVRPRLQQFVDSLSNDSVIEATAAAMEHARAATESWRSIEEQGRLAMDSLTTLKGVGPATASCVLSLMSPHYPFMSDEALEVTGERVYTAPRFFEFAKQCRDKALLLNKHPGTHWTARSVERALWAHTVSARLSVSKRPREEPAAASSNKRVKKQLGARTE
jgi:hypothetical protein